MEKKKVPKPLRAAIYARISRDAEGERLGVERQTNDCRALAEQLGYEVVDIFVDNDISASTKSSKVRPAYGQIIAAARAGQFEAIFAYSNSRLTRRVREYMDLIDLTNKHGVLIKTAVSGQHDLSTADGRGSALTVAVWDQAEAERTAERVSAAKKQAAMDGKYRGGPRPFGYEADGMTIREKEAVIIREATASVIAGRTLASLARELNDRGVTGTRGKPISYNNLRDMLVRPRNAGLLAHGLPGRTHHRYKNREFYPLEIVGPAKWPAIVTEDEWRALVTLLTDPSRRTSQSSDPKWLGSGIYRCGVCGSVLRTAPHGGTAQRPYERKYLYRCVAHAHLTISADATDEYVRGVVAEMVRDPRVIAAMQPNDTGLLASRERRTELTLRLQQFETDYALGRITGTQLQRATTAVNDEMAEVDARLTKALQHSTSSGVLGAADPGEAFLNAPLDIQRAVLSTVIRVEVVTAKEAGVRVGGVWSSDRVRIAPVG